MVFTDLDVLTNASIAVNTKDRLDSIMRLVITRIIGIQSCVLIRGGTT